MATRSTNRIENEGRQPSLPPLTAVTLAVALAVGVALAVDAGRAAAEPPDDATRAAMARHFSGHSETSAESGDPAKSADAMVSAFLRDMPKDMTVASRRPQVELDVKFEFDSSQLTSEGIAQLEIAGQALNDPRIAGRRFMLGGHTDDQGDADYNRSLSLQRAQSARAYLMEKHDIDGERLDAEGFGSDMPKSDDPSPEARRANRRVVLEMVQ